MRLDDSVQNRRQSKFTDAWRQFLRAYNLLQFAPGLEVITTEQLVVPEDRDVASAPAVASPRRRRRPSTIPAVSPTKLSEKLLAELHEAKESLWPVLEQCAAAGAPMPHITYEAEEGECEIEVGWPDLLVGLYLETVEHQKASAEKLAGEGWTLFREGEASFEALSRVLKLKG